MLYDPARSTRSRHRLKQKKSGAGFPAPHQKRCSDYETGLLSSPESLPGSHDHGPPQRQEPAAAAGAESRFSDGDMITSGSIVLGCSRWAPDVKGRPIKSVRSTLDIGCRTGL